MVSCSVLTVNIGVVLAKTEESFGNLRLKIYLCHIIHLFSYQYAMKKYLLLIFVILIHSFAVLADNVKDTYLFRKVDYQLGLSNSAVLSLFQDNEGLMCGSMGQFPVLYLSMKILWLLSRQMG